MILLPALRRLAVAVLSLIALIGLTFLLLKNFPGGPFEEETPLNPLVRENLNRAWALDQSGPRQFLAYMRSLGEGTLGWSMAEPGRSVGSMVREGVGQTLWLNLIAIVVVLALGLALALWGASKPGAFRERFVDVTTVALTSLPGLFLGPLLIWVFAIRFDWLPVAFLDSPKSYVLPVLTLALRPAAAVARLLRTALDEALVTDYVRTARAKGLSGTQALLKHALRNSWLTLIGYGGPLVMGLVSGSFIVEILFAVKGLGSFFFEGIANRDVPVVLGLTLVYGAALIIISAVLDVLLLVVDPRLREVKP